MVTLGTCELPLLSFTIFTLLLTFSTTGFAFHSPRHYHHHRLIESSPSLSRISSGNSRAGIFSTASSSIVTPRTTATSLHMTTPSSTDSSNKLLPRLPLPELIRSDVPGTWAYDTMNRRIDEEILQRTLHDNQDFMESAQCAGILARFQELRFELQHAGTTKLSYLDDDNSAADATIKSETATWNQDILAPYVAKGDTWLTAPWMVTEFYVYRRLVQAFGYFQPSSPGHRYDFFSKQKRDGLRASVKAAEPLLLRVPALSQASLSDGVTAAADMALWGNRMDLSLWPAASQVTGKATDTDASDATTETSTTTNDYYLANDSDALAEHCATLKAKGGGHIDIIVDNAGLELVTDLGLAQYLTESGIAKSITFQLKSHPTFVSDAMERDVRDTVDHYMEQDDRDFPGSHAAGQVWNEYLETGQWKLKSNACWCQPFAMWDLPDALRNDLTTRCDLAVVKGDANYRRLLGDRTWDVTAIFDDVVGAYFPCPVCALRVLKAEIGCGMDKSQVDRAKDMDEKWMVNGKFGVLQFSKGANDK